MLLVNVLMNANASKLVSMQSIDAEEHSEEDMREHCFRSFYQNNRLEHMYRVMSLHPTYLEAFFKVHNFILGDESSPLPINIRHYIAIMAAARHQCLYLMRLHAQGFLMSNGDPKWLKGLEYVPQKIRNLCEVNNILAHRPWLLKKEHFQALTGADDKWAMSQLTQAVIIMVHFHTLSSFIYGCGIAPETDREDFFLVTNANRVEEWDYSSDSSNDIDPNLLEEADLLALMHKMEQLKTECERSEDKGDDTDEELLRRFQSVENQSVQISIPVTDKPSRREEAGRYVTDLDFSYTDFANRPSALNIQTFRVQDYSWKMQGVSVVNNLYNDIGNILDKRFNVAFNLTYKTMGNSQEVDTSAFRQAIWYYIHCMYGIRHDDYNYSSVNKLLAKDLKTYIKTVTCYPERIGKKDYENVMRGFKHSEKVHVNFMIMEARMQAELLYALRVIDHHNWP